MTSSPLPYFGLTKRVIVVDAETSSRVDLPKCGAARYWADPSTRVLMMGFQEVGGPESRVWQPHTGATTLPSFLLDAAAAPSSDVMFAAFNAPFDRAAFERCGVPTRLDQWLDLMTLSYVLAFAGGLDAVLQQFDVLDPTTGKPLTKSPEGRRLITIFSQQRTPWFDRPAEWSQFVGYCRHDVEVEVALFHRLCLWLNQPFLWPQVQTILKQWQIDQRMNERGIPVSLETVKGAIRIRDAEIKRLTDQMRALTGLANPNSGAQLHAWLTAQGQTLPNLQAATVWEALATMAPDSVPAQVLAAKVEIGRSSVKKYDAMLRSHVDGRLKGGYVTCGASRTGRTASRGINLSNLERPKLKEPHLEWAADLLETGDPATLDLWRSDPHKVSTMGVLGSCVRGALKAPPGYGITAVDLKSIESVGLAWLAGCNTILDLFFEGRDTYKDFATRYYGIRYEDVTGDQRTFCKPAVLGCLGADTQVLTDCGWKPIVDVALQDRVWDGDEWVAHDGVIFQGVKTVITHESLTATPDHQFLMGGTWLRWGDIWTSSRRNWVMSGAPVYDILNAGPRHRFTVMCDSGRLIAHNCGYGASGSALVAYAAGMGITLTQEEADRSVETFRASFPEIPALWQAVDRAAKSAILQPNVPIHTHRTTFLYDGVFLHIRLPSDRTLFYYKPMIERRLIKSKHKDRDDFWADNITYMGKQQDDGGAWTRVATRGAKIVENLIQAICRDVLYNALELIDRDPEMQLIGSTYDEAILLTPLDDRAPTIWERLTGYMTTRPSWADGRFFLGCDGYLNAARYRK